MMINTVPQNYNMVNISFRGNLKRKILSGISSGIKVLNSDNYTQEDKSGNTNNIGMQLLADIMQYAVISNQNEAEKEQDITENYIKQQCVSALECLQPYEKTIIYNPEAKKIEGVYCGNEDSCNININNTATPNSLEIHHGHPQRKQGDEFYTLPVSIDDFEVLNSNSSVKKIIAYDINGNKSELSKADDFVKLSEDEKENLKAEYLTELKKAMPEENQNNFDYLAKYCKKYPKEANAIMLKVYKKLLEFQYSSQGAKAINKFWEKISEKYHLIYISNYK